MIYNYLKILHIFSATLLITSIVYSISMWRERYSPRVGAIISSRIQTQTCLVIIPIALIQMGTGFTMLSLQEDDLSQLWIVGSIIGFIIFITSWFGFLYFLLVAQQMTADSQDRSASFDRHQILRRIQSFMLMLCAGALFSMVYFMSNKAT